MDTLGGGCYWGAMGRAPAWDRYFQGNQEGPPPQGFIRYGGGAPYAGVIVVLVALWAVLQTSSKSNSPFGRSQHGYIRFWTGVAVLSLVLALGRYAPFYRLVFELPYFSNIRNPGKFVHIFSFAMIILFAYGIHGIYRRSLVVAPAGTITPNRKNDGHNRFDRRWFVGSVLAIVGSVVGWIVYASERPALEQYLQTVQFTEGAATAIAGFSIRQVGWFVLFLAATVVLLHFVFRGRFCGRNAKLGGVLLGVLLVADLGRANQPWIIYWDYVQKYASNPVIDLLRDKPYEHRAASLPTWLTYHIRLPEALAATEAQWDLLYANEWSQNLFPFYNIQSPDVVQMRVVPKDLLAFDHALEFLGTEETVHLVTRRWELTNTRYLLGAVGFLQILNAAIDPGQNRFRIINRFEIAPKPRVVHPVQYQELTANLDTNGRYALFEFTGALPRAALYTNWQVITNDEITLGTLTNVRFDPAQQVLVANPVPPASTNFSTLAPGTVSYTAYAPKRITLDVSAKAPSILLLNDKFDPNWKVFLDEQPAQLLRCNYVMRGVQVPPGDHHVKFQFAPPNTPLYVSLSALIIGLGLTGFSILTKRAMMFPDAQSVESRTISKAGSPLPNSATT